MKTKYRSFPPLEEVFSDLEKVISSNVYISRFKFMILISPKLRGRNLNKMGGNVRFGT